MGTARTDVYELLKTNLLLEDAVAGEAAGLAMGLVMLGTGSAQAIEDMVQVRLTNFLLFHFLSTVFLVCTRNTTRKDSKRLSDWYCSSSIWKIRRGR